MPSLQSICAGDAYVNLWIKTAEFEAGLQEMQSKVAGIGDRFKNVGDFLRPVSDGVKSTVQTFAGFDDTMRFVQSKLGNLSDDQIAKLTERAKELGRTTSFTAQEVASGMVQIATSTGSFDTTYNAIGSVMNLARASGTDIFRTADIVTNAMTQFGIGADEIERISDVMLVATNNSAQNLDDFGFALSYAGKIAHEAGLSIEDTSKIIGVLANMGIKGSSAGTALRAMISRLAAPTKASSDALKELGVSVTDASGNLRPVLDVVNDIGKALSGAGSGTQLAVLKGLFGQTAMTASSGLMNFDPGTLFDAIDRAQGAAQKAAETMDAGIGGSFRMMQSAIEGVVLALGNGFTPSMKIMVDAITPAATALASFVSDHPKLTAAFGAIGTSVVGASTGMTAFGLAFKGVSGGIQALGVSVGAVARSMEGISAFAAKGGSITRVFSALVSNPYILGFAALGASILYVAKCLHSSANEAEKLNQALGKTTSDNNILRQEDLDKLNALIQFEQAGNLGKAQEGVARTALNELTKKYGTDFGVKIENGKVTGASSAKEGLDEAIRQSALNDIQRQIDAYDEQINKARNRLGSAVSRARVASSSAAFGIGGGFGGADAARSDEIRKQILDLTAKRDELQSQVNDLSAGFTSIAVGRSRMEEFQTPTMPVISVPDLTHFNGSSLSEQSDKASIDSNDELKDQTEILRRIAENLSEQQVTVLD